MRRRGNCVTTGETEDNRALLASQSAKEALWEALPLAAAIATYGLSYGVLALQAHLDFPQALAMSLLVFSGSVQLVAVGMLSSGAGAVNILLAAALLNLRNLLYGAALAENLSAAGKKWRYLLVFGVSDEPFVLGSARFRKKGPDPVYFGVMTALFYLAWVLSSLGGTLIGGGLDFRRLGLDLAFPVAFTALLTPSLEGLPGAVTALAAAALTCTLNAAFPGNTFAVIAAGAAAPLLGLAASGGNRDE